jgi:hypothetical protein
LLVLHLSEKCRLQILYATSLIVSKWWVITMLSAIFQKEWLK